MSPSFGFLCACVLSVCVCVCVCACFSVFNLCTRSDLADDGLALSPQGKSSTVSLRVVFISFFLSFFFLTRASDVRLVGDGRAVCSPQGMLCCVLTVSLCSPCTR